jgi:hypothetical protein
MYQEIMRKVKGIFGGNNEPLEPPPNVITTPPERLLPPGTSRGIMQRSRERVEEPAADPYLTSIATYITALRKANEAESKTKPEGMAKPAPRRPESVKERVYGSNLGQQLVEEIMQQYDLSREAAAGIVGSFDYETGAFKYMQEIEPLVKGSRGGTGYAMWTGPRRREFERFAQEQGLDIGSREGNMAFFRYEMENTREGRVLEKLRNVTSAEEAARIFTNEFLRPSKKHANMDERIRRANLYMTVRPAGE